MVLAASSGLRQVELAAKAFSRAGLVFGNAQLHHLGSPPQLVETIAPPLHHLNPRLKLVAAIVDATHHVAIAMGEGALDGIRMPLTGLVQEG